MATINDQIEEKILSIETLSQVVADLKSQGKVIVHCHGVYDLFTPAHMYQFTQAKAKGDVLVVTLTEDQYVNKGPGRPFFNEVLRARQVASQVAVDYVAISRWPSGVQCIRLLKPDFFVKGESNRNYKEDGNSAVGDEVAAVRESSGDIFFTEELPFHSSELLNRFLPVFPPATQSWLREFKKRHSAESVIAALRNLKGVRCLLIGETIIDRYVYVKALGKPTKGSHIAADILSEESHAGGILAAANHLAGFCERVDVLTCIGSDGKDMGLRELLKGNVRPTFFLRDGDTIVKTRYTERFSYQKMFQTYQGMTQPLHENDEHRLREVLSLLFANGKYDLVLVIDYGHGFISDECAEFISQHAPWLALSVQTNTANFGHNVVTKYSRARYVCVDEPEIRLAFRSQWGNPEELALKLLQQPDHEYESIILTRGHHGCVIPNPTFPSCNIPAFSTQVVDAVGAGDAFIALTSPCMKKGMPIELAGFIGNAIGALAVGTVGNRSSVEPMTLFNFINTLLK